MIWIEPEEILLIAFTIAALAGTFYLRKELEDHGFHIWVYATIPLVSLSMFVVSFSHEIPIDLADMLFYSLSAISTFTMLLGAVMAIRRRR